MDEKKEYSIAKEVGIVFTIGISLGLFILIVGLLIVEFMKV
jgi:hypothetical protein